MKRLLKWVLGPSDEEMEAIINDMVKDGYLEIIGLDHGEPIYRTTKKGLEFLEEIKRQRK